MKFKTFVFYTLEKIKSLKNKLQLEKEKIIALTLAGRLFILVFLVSMFQIPVQVQSKVENPKPTFIHSNFKSEYPVFGYEVAKLNFVLGESNVDQRNREQNQLASASNRTVAVRERAVGNPGEPTEFRAIYQAAGARFNIPWQIIEAVHQVETGKSGSTSKSSYAGATGPMQFMPGTWRAYAVDGDGNGDADICNVTDAIYTGARYLANGGADEGRIRDALFNYNHSQAYVNKVLDVAYSIGFSM